jgi:predicted outer membrane repeat protein
MTVGEAKTARRLNKNKANVQRVKPRVPSQIVIKEVKGNDQEVGSAAYRESFKNVQDLVDAILTQRRAYVLPRYVGTPVAPHQFSWKKTLSLDTAEKLKGCFTISNDTDRLLSLGFPDVAGQIVAKENYNSAPGQACTVPTGSNIMVDYTLLTTTGQQVKTSSAPIDGCWHWSNSKGKYIPGFKYYKCGLADGGPAELIMAFNNAAGKGCTINFQAGTLNNDNSLNIMISTAVASSAIEVKTYDLATNANWADFVAASDATNSMWFGVQYLPTSGSGAQSSGFYVGLNFTDATPISSPLVWTSYSLWQLLAEGAVPKLQFDKAARHNVTGQMVTFSNNTSELIKGGSIYAARLPGNTYGELAGDVDGVIKLVSSQVHHALEDTHLSTGLNYSFTPEKIQDWLFERQSNVDPVNGNPENLPYLACAFDATNATEGVPTFTFSGKISLEYLTTDPSNFFIAGPANAVLFEAILNSLASENGVSCNPDHMDHLKKVVKNVMTSDNVKYAIKSMISAGVKVAPFVLSLL